jgi:2'-5' RNA ligase
MERPETIRAFVAVELTSQLKTSLQDVQTRLRRQLPPQSVRWATPDQLHLTLRFLGNVEASQIAPLTQALDQARQGIPPISLRLAGCGCFPDERRPRVLWIGLQGAPPALQQLGQLQQCVDQASAQYGDHQEDKAFHPHLTIGRVSKEARLHDFGKVLADLGEAYLGDWTIAEYILVRSTLTPSGAEYSTMASFPLTDSKS